MDLFRWGEKETDKAPVEWAFLSLAADPAPAPPGQDDEEYYVTIDLGSMRVPGVKRGYTKLYAAVHSFISAPTFETANNAEFRVVTTPAHLKKVPAIDVGLLRELNLYG